MLPPPKVFTKSVSPEPEGPATTGRAMRPVVFLFQPRAPSRGAVPLLQGTPEARSKNTSTRSILAPHPTARFPHSRGGAGLPAQLPIRAPFSHRESQTGRQVKGGGLWVIRLFQKRNVPPPAPPASTPPEARARAPLPASDRPVSTSKYKALENFNQKHSNFSSSREGEARRGRFIERTPSMLSPRMPAVRAGERSLKHHLKNPGRVRQ